MTTNYTTIYVSTDARDKLGEAVDEINRRGLKPNLAAATGQRGLSRAAAFAMLVETYTDELVELLTGEGEA